MSAAFSLTEFALIWVAVFALLIGVAVALPPLYSLPAYFSGHRIPLVSRAVNLWLRWADYWVDKSIEWERR